MTEWDFPKQAKDLLAVACRDHDPEYAEAVRRFLTFLHGAGVEYVLAGSLAVLVYGGRCFTAGASLLMPPASWQKFTASPGSYTCYEVPGMGYRVAEPEGEDGITRAFIVAVRDGVTKKKKATRLYGLPVIKLKYLIRRNLQERRSYNIEEVVSLIRAQHLDESFCDHLPPELHSTYLHYLRRTRESHT